mmetsp:Transcript_4401/g.12905  ORF Transcript_4401/g.12905 Transcript_4401/m.12905 type:complete len:430 (-) Transcript_4401:114-1403(-)
MEVGGGILALGGGGSADHVQGEHGAHGAGLAHALARPRGRVRAGLLVCRPLRLRSAAPSFSHAIVPARECRRAPGRRLREPVFVLGGGAEGLKAGLRPRLALCLGPARARPARRLPGRGAAAPLARLGLGEVLHEAARPNVAIALAVEPRQRHLRRGARGARGLEEGECGGLREGRGCREARHRARHGRERARACPLVEEGSGVQTSCEPHQGAPLQRVGPRAALAQERPDGLAPKGQTRSRGEALLRRAPRMHVVVELHQRPVGGVVANALRALNASTHLLHLARRARGSRDECLGVLGAHEHHGEAVLLEKQAGARGVPHVSLDIPRHCRRRTCRRGHAGLAALEHEHPGQIVAEAALETVQDRPVKDCAGDEQSARLGPGARLRGELRDRPALEAATVRATVAHEVQRGKHAAVGRGAPRLPRGVE